MLSKLILNVMEPAGKAFQGQIYLLSSLFDLMVYG
jgi:hypothetical protein